MKNAKLAPPPWPYLLLLPLLTVLLFGNCGGGVRGTVNGLGDARRLRFRAIIVQERAHRAAARHRLRGKDRHSANSRIDSVKAARLDSLFHEDYGGYERAKYRRHRRKMERQLLHENNRPLIPPIRWPSVPMH